MKHFKLISSVFLNQLLYVTYIKKNRWAVIQPKNVENPLEVKEYYLRTIPTPLALIFIPILLLLIVYSIAMTGFPATIKDIKDTMGKRSYWKNLFYERTNIYLEPHMLDSLSPFMKRVKFISL